MLKLSVPVLLVERDAGVAPDEGHEDRQTDNSPIPASADVHSVLWNTKTHRSERSGRAEDDLGMVEEPLRAVSARRRGSYCSYCRYWTQ